MVDILETVNTLQMVNALEMVGTLEMIEQFRILSFMVVAVVVAATSASRYL